MKHDNPILKRLGMNVRSLRKDAGLSQEALAFRAGIDRTYIADVERGERNLGVLNLCRIAQALDVFPGALLEGISLEPQEEQSS